MKSCFFNFLTDKFFLCFFIFFYCISCKNLNQHRKSTETNSLPEKQRLFQKDKVHFPYLSEIIDSNYLEIQADIAYLKGEEAFYKGNNKSALSHFQSALIFAPKSPFLKQKIAQIYEQEGLSAEALYYYKALLKKDFKKEELYQQITNIYLQQGLNEPAHKYLQQLLNQKPGLFSLWLRQALLFIHQKDWKSALKSLKQGKSKAHHTEEKIQALLAESHVFAQLNRKPALLDNMNQISQMPFPSEELALQVAQLYKSLGQDDQALNYLEKFQESKDTTKALSEELFNYYTENNNYEKALKQLKKIQYQGELENQHFFYMTLLLIEKKQYDQALLFLKDLINEHPENGHYLYLKAGVYEQQKKWQTALKIYDQVPSHSPHFLTAHLQTAHLLNKTGQKRKAFSLFKKLAFSPDGKPRPQALLLYAESLWNEGYKKKALTLLTKGLKQKPFHPDLLFLRGIYLKESGYPKQALQDMQSILKKQKNHEEALRFIASFNSQQESH